MMDDDDAGLDAGNTLLHILRQGFPYIEK